jgi:hypothetical protein
MLKTALATILIVFYAAAFADEPDLVNCRFSTGIKMEPDECALYQKLEADKKAKHDQEQTALRQIIEADAQRQAQEREARRQASEEAAQRSAQLDAARKKEYDATMAAIEKEDADYERGVQAQAKARKAACGTDYLKPQIGMSIQRAQQCVGRFTYAGTTHTAQGNIATYLSRSTRLDVVNDKIMAWTRY